ncbi:hypothetical protein [Streptococcus mutans]|uniref:hypothetical protein n=1 Tax=Streptococcus mutans TaxID=1309 RepID=UPI0002B5CC4F|nr:hypothetical protein [Streptococcus mutans]EMB75629.1 hypothetical protein SMU41_05745 [Streptococcus mutans 2VS1]
MKQAKAIDKQLNILKSRGLVIENQGYVYGVLQNINYYTLTGYSIELEEILYTKTLNLNLFL